jgi:hypothetical protein
MKGVKDVVERSLRGCTTNAPEMAGKTKLAKGPGELRYLIFLTLQLFCYKKQEPNSISTEGGDETGGNQFLKQEVVERKIY